MLYKPSWVFLIPSLPWYMASYWESWMIVDWNKLYLNLICFDFLGSSILYHFKDRNSLAGLNFLYLRYVLQQFECVVIILWGDIRLVNLVFLGSPLISGVNQVSLWSIFSCAPPCGLLCTRSVQFWGIVPFLMNGTVEIHNQTPHKIRVRRDQFLDLESEILILHEIVIYQYISLQESWVPTLLFQIYWLIFLHPRHKLDRPMCADFKW